MNKWMIILLALVTLVLTGCEPDVTITLEPGHDTVTVNTLYTPEGCTVKINRKTYDMEITTNTVDVESVGTYLIEYEYDEYTCNRIVTVVDDVAPTLELLPGLDTVYVGTTWIDGGVVAIDNYDDSVTVETTIPDGLTNGEVGSYVVTYTATDYYGNSETLSRFVTILDLE